MAHDSRNSKQKSISDVNKQPWQGEGHSSNLLCLGSFETIRPPEEDTSAYTPSVKVRGQSRFQISALATDNQLQDLEKVPYQPEPPFLSQNNRAGHATLWGFSRGVRSQRG